MARNASTVIAIAVSLSSIVSAGLYALNRHGTAIPTELMLDVSVSIKTVGHVTIDKVGDSVWSAGSGSGIFISAEKCEVWTNYHVVRDAALIEIFPRSWDSATGIPARVVNFSPPADLAVLEMDRCKGIVEATLGDSDTVRAGDETYAVGNPLGLNPDSITRGIISHTERYKIGATPYLQTDAAINPGNSGGALFNRQGKIVGINTGLARSVTNSGRGSGIGYAIPINVALETATRLRSGPPSWGDAGLEDIVSNLTPEEARLFHVPNGYGGIVLIDTPQAGPGVGKLLARDVIFKIDGGPVSTAEQAMRLIASYEPGAQLGFELIRNGQPQRIDITLADGWKGHEAPQADAYEGYLGLSLEIWGDEEGEPEAFDSPVIAHVHSLSPAHRAHITSSQHNVALQGPFVVPYVLDVKTITGAVYDGTYRPISDIHTLDRLSAQAFEVGEPLLLEIEYWGRHTPSDPSQPLEHIHTGFFRIQPARSSRSPLRYPGGAPVIMGKPHIDQQVTWHEGV